MSAIVCAIRGGPGSDSTIQTAVDLAKENDQPLYFLYVFDIDFLHKTTQSRVQTLRQQMEEMGKFILLEAQDAARQAGLEAQGIVRQGQVTQEIIALCRELQADYLVIGRPNADLDDSLFNKARLEEFIRQVETQTGARVIMPDVDEP